MKKETQTVQSGGGVEAMAETIRKTLADFDVPIEIVSAVEGFRFFHFHLKTLKPVRMRIIQSFQDDLRYALGSDKLMIEAPIPDKQLIGIKVPKKEKAPVLRWVDAERTTSEDGIFFPLGKDEFGETHHCNLIRVSDMLIAGATGSGKSMLLHSFLNSLFMQYTPDKLRLILVDTKQNTFPSYNTLPHLLTSVIEDPKKAILSLKWANKEMERRFGVLEKCKARDIGVYHKAVNAKHVKKDDVELMPYIVVVIDEIADLMAMYPKETEKAIVPLTQMGRAVGIHLIIATQRPSVNIITGMMKANIPCRIALRVVSNVDARIILDRTGAEELEGPGEFLYDAVADDYALIRLQSYYLTDEEIARNVTKVKKEYGAFTDPSVSLVADEDAFDDDLYEEAKEVVVTSGKASVSYLQRRLGIGYSRAGKIMDRLEKEGIISAGRGSEPREVWVRGDLKFL